MMRLDKNELANHLLIEGVADAKVISQFDAKDKEGRDIINLVLWCRDANGKEGEVKKSLKDIGMVKRFCHSSNRMDRFEKDYFAAEDCKDARCKVMLGVDINKTGEWPDKNYVKWFVPPGSTNKAEQLSAASQNLQGLATGFTSHQEKLKNEADMTGGKTFDDDIPF